MTGKDLNKLSDQVAHPHQKTFGSETHGGFNINKALVVMRDT